MTENFFLDNLDLQFRLAQLDLRDILEIKEKGYTLHDAYTDAPRNYADAIDNFRLQLEILGDISANIVAPTAAEADEKGAQYLDGNVEYADVTKEGIEAFKQAELMGAMLPREYGGLNLPETIYQMMVEIVSRAEAGLMTVFGLQEIAASINDYADEETKARILPRFGRGEVSGAMVLTEPDAGSDLGNVQTKASYDEAAGFWRLNGVKRFITNGNADVQVVLARSEEGSTDARGLSLFVIERDESVRIRRIENKLGIHASPTCEIQYRDTPAWLIGKRRFGLIRYAMALMNGARLAVGAQAVGIAEAAYREAYKYANERIQFNQPIMKLPAVSQVLHHRDGQPGLLPGDADTRRRRLHARVQRRAPLPRRARDQHLRRHQPDADRGGTGETAGPRPGRSTRSVGFAGLRNRPGGFEGAARRRHRLIAKGDGRFKGERTRPHRLLRRRSGRHRRLRGQLLAAAPGRTPVRTQRRAGPHLHYGTPAENPCRR
ncbi:MAG: acyl-CoA dehydrogenase family protein [Anaerolineales bacterium]